MILSQRLVKLVVADVGVSLRLAQQKGSAGRSAHWRRAVMVAKQHPFGGKAVQLRSGKGGDGAVPPCGSRILKGGPGVAKSQVVTKDKDDVGLCRLDARDIRRSGDKEEQGKNLFHYKWSISKRARY